MPKESVMPTTSLTMEKEIFLPFPTPETMIIPEDMFWIRQGRHYGFPWVMGGIDNPQQNPDWQPNPDTDPFLSKFAFAWLMKYFHNDPDFPKRPAGVTFTPAVQNLGPDANEYRDRKTGVVMDGDTTGVTVGTFNAHSSPLGFDFR